MNDKKQLNALKRCRGQYSIQWEINKLAKELGGTESEDNPDGRKWNKLIQDKNYVIHRPSGVTTRLANVRASQDSCRTKGAIASVLMKREL